MIELEYGGGRGEAVIASIAAGDPPVIPNSGDRVDVPTDDGTVACVTVSRRHFYYLPDHRLVRVRLYCS